MSRGGNIQEATDLQNQNYLAIESLKALFKMKRMTMTPQ